MPIIGLTDRPASFPQIGILRKGARAGRGGRAMAGGVMEYNAATPRGAGWICTRAERMDVQTAQAIINSRGDDAGAMFGNATASPHLTFDYLHGRPLKIDLRGEALDPWGFDRDNGGPGTAAGIIARLRQEN